MLFGSNGAASAVRSQQSGQMSVELALCIPVILMVTGVLLNVLGYLNVCARFDRVAAEAIRIEATSPGYGQAGSDASAARARALIERSFAQSLLSIGVDIAIEVEPQDALAGGSGVAGADIGFSLLPRLETYRCSITYHPWPFDRIAGLRFFVLTHQRDYTVDPYRPGVFF
ncbi:MAG: hypothetical protein LBU07_05650 [Coriobacteriales bacterium]|jgi:hypothetical protein|nr:hypothetical protein [Coriobacteriales bacterium]